MTSLPSEHGQTISGGRILAKYDTGETKAGKKGVQTYEEKSFFAKIIAVVSRNLMTVFDPDTKTSVVVDRKSLEAFLRRNQDSKLKKSVDEGTLYATYLTFLNDKVRPPSLPTIKDEKISGTAGQFGGLFRALEPVGVVVSLSLANVVASDIFSGVKKADVAPKGEPSFQPPSEISFPLEVFANSLTIPDEARRLAAQVEPMESKAAVGEKDVPQEIKDFINTMYALQVKKLPAERQESAGAREKQFPKKEPEVPAEKKGLTEIIEEAKEEVEEMGDILVGRLAEKMSMTAEELKKGLAALPVETLENIQEELKRRLEVPSGGQKSPEKPEVSAEKKDLTEIIEKTKEEVEEMGDIPVGQLAENMGMTAEELKEGLAVLPVATHENIQEELIQEDVEMDALAELLKKQWIFGEAAQPEAQRTKAAQITKPVAEPREGWVMLMPKPEDWNSLADGARVGAGGEWRTRIQALTAKGNYDLLADSGDTLRDQQAFVGVFLAVVRDIKSCPNNEEKERLLQDLRRFPLSQQLCLCLAACTKAADVSEEVKMSFFKNLRESFYGTTKRQQGPLTNYFKANRFTLRTIFGPSLFKYVSTRPS